MSKISQRGGAAANEGPGPPARRSFSDRARRAALLHTQGHSRKQIAELIGVAPETISVWKRHPQWQRELDRWRELAETPLDATQMRLKLESLEAMTTALEQLQLLMGATKPVSRGGTVSKTARLANTTESLPTGAGNHLRRHPRVPRPAPPDTGRSPHTTHRR